MFIPAGENERFASGSSDAQVGKTVPFKLDDRHVADATVISAEVAEDGSGVSLTVEIPDMAGTEAITEQAAGHFSFSPKPPWRPGDVVHPARDLLPMVLARP